MTFEKTTAHPYILYAGDDLASDHDRRAMHLLCHALNLVGAEAYIAGSTVVSPHLETPVLTESILEACKAAQRLPITVYPGSVEGNPLSSRVVARYVLNASDDLIEKDFGTVDTDLVFYVSHEVSHGAVEPILLTLALNDGTPVTLPDGDELQRFIALTSQAAERYQRRMTLDIPRWLEARRLTAVQRRLLDAHQALNAQSSVTVIVQDPSGQPEALAKTLANVLSWRARSATAIGVHVLSLHTPPGTLPAGVSWDRLGAAPARQINTLIDGVDHEWLLLLNAGDELIESGTCLLEQQLPRSSASMLYGDEIHRSGEQTGPAFRPDINLDYLLSLPVVMATHWLFRRDAFLAFGGFDDQLPQALEFDLILRIIDGQGLGAIEHLTEPLLSCESPSLHPNPDEITALERHLHNRGYTAHQVREYPARHYHIHYGHTAEPLVSIIVPTKDQLPILRRCVETLLEKTQYFNYELIIVDNDSQTEEALAWLAELDAIGGQKIRVLRYPYPFNYSAINNFAVSQSKGEYVVLLNNDTAILDGGWLHALLNHAQRPEVGVVGAKLLFPNGLIQHAGVVVGLDGPAGHPFIGQPAATPGYMQRVMVDQNYSAVTAACLMIRRSIYEEVAGLDEDLFKVSYNDVDLCLKVGAQGYLIVWTPHALLLHEGSVSQTHVDRTAFAAKLRRFRSEQHGMMSKWLPVMANDPAYNRNLSLEDNGFRIDGRTELTWRPLKGLPLPTVLAFPAVESASARRRTSHPFDTLKAEGLLDGVIGAQVPSVVDVERYQPDSLILHRRLDPPRLESMRSLASFAKRFRVLDIDGLPSELEMANAVQVAEGLVDRILVATPALADIFDRNQAPVQVLPSRLSGNWALPLSKRLANPRPRIGCFVSSEQHSDIPLIEALMRELEVNWVLLGDGHPRLNGLAQEVHRNAHFWGNRDLLAGLNLDLALVPLRDTLSNHCRDHGLLLEYGACGVPVLCSDVDGFRGELPVQRLNNDVGRWRSAIADHLHDEDARIARGDQLRSAVLTHWVQDAASLQTLLKAWLP